MKPNEHPASSVGVARGIPGQVVLHEVGVRSALGVRSLAEHRQGDIAAVQVRGPLGLRGEEGAALARIPRLPVVPQARRPGPQR